MKMSRRAKRMQKAHKRKKGTAALNITSLMDIFTLMVFFLLFNATGVELSTGTKIKLPEAKASVSPKESVVITVDRDDIAVQGRRVASVQEVLASNDAVIGGLRQELEFQRSGTKDANTTNQQDVTIVGDRQLPYRLIKRLMMTCSIANYGNISLAVSQKSGKKG